MFCQFSRETPPVFLSYNPSVIHNVTFIALSTTLVKLDFTIRIYVYVVSYSSKRPSPYISMFLVHFLDFIFGLLILLVYEFWIQFSLIVVSIKWLMNLTLISKMNESLWKRNLFSRGVVEKLLELINHCVYIIQSETAMWLWVNM